MKTRVVVIDNYDSFAYNLVQAIGTLIPHALIIWAIPYPWCTIR